MTGGVYSDAAVEDMQETSKRLARLTRMHQARRVSILRVAARLRGDARSAQLALPREQRLFRVATGKKKKGPLREDAPT